MSKIPMVKSKILKSSEAIDAIQNIPRSLNRRSKSVSDLRSTRGLEVNTRQPLINTSRREIVNNPKYKAPLITVEKKLAEPSKAGPSKPVPSRAVVSRAGPSIESPKARAGKITKRPKVPDWDFKTRYQLEKEKCMKLLESNQTLKDRIEENEDLNDRFNDLREENQGNIKKIQTIKDSYRVEKENFVSCIENLKEENVKQKKFYELQIENMKREIEEKEGIHLEQIKNLEKKSEESLDTIKKLNEKCEESLVTIAEHKEIIFNGDKLRRVLHNTIQDLKGNIRVFCRIRPILNTEENIIKADIHTPTDTTIEISKLKQNLTSDKQEFNFDKVFDQTAEQEEIFEELGQLVQSALDGYHICVFAYGQTGSGKTYTMQGIPTNLGMIPLSVDLIFKTKREMEKIGWKYIIHASFLEIYNENVRDLLNINEKNLEIRFNEGKGTSVTNLKIIPIETESEFKKLMQESQQNRATAVTNYNEHSSRSHAVTKIYIESLYKNKSFIGSINLVDLAGSESAKLTTKERLKETQNINKSLSCLSNVLIALYKKETHIPYRNSKLTFLLQSSLGGNCKCLMIANISPRQDCFNESVNVLRFASKVKDVKVSVSKNRNLM